YPDVHPHSQEISDEVFQAKGDLMKSIQTFLEEFTYIPFGEKPQILLQAWYKFFAIQHAQPEDSNELFHKLIEDLQNINKDLIECNQVCEEQKQNMENTILEFVEICQQKELYCMHDNVKDLIESALNFKLLLINSQRLNKEKQEVKNVVEQPAERRTLAHILSTKVPEYSPSMGYEHPNTTSEIESEEIIKSGVEELVPILNENGVTLEDKRECDLPVCENSPICDDHSEIFSDSNNDDDISSDDNDFKDIDINHLIANIESLNDNHTPDHVLNSSVLNPIFKESDNSLSDNFSPELESFCDQTKETRSGNTTTHAHDSLPEYDSFCFEIEPDQERLIKNDISDDSTNDPLLEEVDLFLASDNSIP
nr:hypothetical protein [Tanacetum cinerariifolium]